MQGGIVLQPFNRHCCYVLPFCDVDIGTLDAVYTPFTCVTRWARVRRNAPRRHCELCKDLLLCFWTGAAARWPQQASALPCEHEIFAIHATERWLGWAGKNGLLCVVTI